MTRSQQEAREERIAIMTADKEMTEAEAQAYCNRQPELYGIHQENTKQEGLF